jgi:pimeloyl-ACP methyl ester carboxylesterase
VLGVAALPARAITGAALAAALLACSLAACTGSGSPSSQRSAGQAAAATAVLRWHSCPGAVQSPPGGRKLRCAMLQVPLDYQHPAGRKIGLALSEVLATAPASQQQGVLLVNPGGPGASGLSLAAQVAGALSASVSADYDIVGFDTRGVGASVPALTCDPSFFARPRPEYVPANAADEQALIGRAREYAADCERRFGWLLPYMTTQDMARDMDSIRAALGQQQISYLGYSYGTYLGQVYGTMFPKRVRRMVLDSVVDPDGVWWDDNIMQDYAFQGRMDAFFAWTAANDDVFHLGSTSAQVQASVAEASARLEAHPIAGPSGPLIGPDELSDTLLAGGYSNAFWPDLATSLSYFLQNGNTSDLLALYQAVGKQGENEFAVYNAVECSDVAWSRNWAYWNADTRKVYATAPYETWANAWFNAACAFWPVRGAAAPMRIDGSGLPPLLMLQGTLDAATPYQGALVARRLLPSARMVVVAGGGNHGQSLSSPPNPCVMGYLNRYLGNGTLPASSALVSATCPALPPPAA